jgi:hypothetical protein
MLLGIRLELGVELGFAEEASLMRVVRIAWIGQLHGADHDMHRPDLRGNRARFFHLLWGVCLRKTCCGDRAFAKRQDTGLEQQRTIDPA